jgi:hypothetical protein
MNGQHTAAWIAAGLMALGVAGLVLKRSASFAEARSRYSLLQKAMILATAISVGALMGLGAFLIVSGLGG